MILNRFLARTEYSSYEDLYENFKLNIPEDFNFAYDVVDEYAKTEPKREALVWCDDNDESHIFTFKDLSIASQRTANFLVEKGIKKGDRVMLILRRRYEFWFFLLALHRIGAIAIPATNMLAAEDLEYRFKAADIKMVVSYDDCIQQNIGIKKYSHRERMYCIRSSCSISSCVSSTAPRSLFTFSERAGLGTFGNGNSSSPQGR